MKEILKNIKFGDRFLTKNGKLAIFWFKNDKEDQSCCYHFIFPNNYEGQYNIDGLYCIKNEHSEEYNLIKKL